jgi:phospholipid/cholesterol/gamma-HCH transport system permease protein
MNFIDRIGERFLARVRLQLTLVAVLGGILYVAVHPRYWPRTVRAVIGRQILFTGVEALGLVLLVSVLAGVSVVSQAQLWLSRIGQSELLGSLLVAVIINVLGPLLVNLVVIARSGTAIATELASMRVRREIDVLEAQGVDPMVYLVMPRALGVLATVFALTMLFIVGALVSGYVFGSILGVSPGSPWRFTRDVLKAATPASFASLLAITMVPGLMTGTICCVEGLGVKGAATEVPQAATRAVVRSIIGLILVAAVVSVLSFV